MKSRQTRLVAISRLPKFENSEMSAHVYVILSMIDG